MQSETLENRLARRRRIRNKNIRGDNSIDQSEVAPLNRSPTKTTRSLDRVSSTRQGQVASSLIDQRQPSSKIIQNSDLPPAAHLYSKRIPPLSENKTYSSPFLTQSTEEEHESSQTTSANEHHQKSSHHDDKPIPTKEPILSAQPHSASTEKKPESSPRETPAFYAEKPVTIRNTASSRLSSPVPPATIRKQSDADQQRSPIRREENSITIKDTAPFIPSADAVSTRKEKSYASYEETDLRDAEQSVIISDAKPSTTTEKSQSSNQKIHSQYEQKSAIIRDTTPPIPSPVKSSPRTEKSQSSREETYSPYGQKPTILRDTIPLVLPPVVPSPRIPRYLVSRSTAMVTEMRDLRCTSVDHPSSDPHPNISHQQKQFHFPPLHFMPIVRTTSDQTLSMNKRRQYLVDPAFSKPNSLALSYLFSKRMVENELARASSSDNDPSPRKTVWD